MNWLMWEKMFTYLYNKLLPVNHMHYIKCAVKSTLHYSGCCRRSVALWIPLLSWHPVFTKRVIYKFIFVWYSTEQCHSNRPTSHLVHLYMVPFFGHDKHSDRSALGLKISLATVCYGPRVAKHFLGPYLVLQPICGWGDLGSFQLPQSNSSTEGAWNLCRYI